MNFLIPKDVANAPLPPPLNLSNEVPTKEYLVNNTKRNIDKASNFSAVRKIRQQIREEKPFPKNVFKVLSNSEASKCQTQNDYGSLPAVPAKPNIHKKKVMHLPLRHGGEVLGSVYQYGTKIPNPDPRDLKPTPRNLQIFDAWEPAPISKVVLESKPVSEKKTVVYTEQKAKFNLKYSKPGTYILLKAPEKYKSKQTTLGKKKSSTLQYFAIYYKYKKGKRNCIGKINIVKNAGVYSVSHGNEAVKKMSSLLEVFDHYKNQGILIKPFRKRIILPNYYKTLSFEKAKVLLRDAGIGQFVKSVQVKENRIKTSLYFNKKNDEGRVSVKEYSFSKKFPRIDQSSKKDRRTAVLDFLNETIERCQKKYSLTIPVQSALECVVTPESIEKFIRTTKKIKRLYQGILKGAKPLAKEYLGEALDKKHHYGLALKPFKELWQRVNTEDPFEVWLDKINRDENVPGIEEARHIPTDRMTEVIYMNSIKRKKYELQVYDGHLCNQQYGFFKNSSDWNCYIYVVSPQGKLYVGIYERGKMNHSSFLSGGAVKAAGELIIENGRIIEITDKSGHYQPTPKMVLEGLKALRSYKVDLNDVRIVFNSTSEKHWYIIDDAAEYLERGISAEKWKKFQKHPKSHGVLPRGEAEKYLEQLPIGAALLRFSQGGQDFVISKRTGSQRINHEPKRQRSLEALKHAAGVNFLVSPELYKHHREIPEEGK